jgi:hypothetical protein
MAPIALPRSDGTPRWGSYGSSVLLVCFSLSLFPSESCLCQETNSLVPSAWDLAHISPIRMIDRQSPPKLCLLRYAEHSRLFVEIVAPRGGQVLFLAFRRD